MSYFICGCNDPLLSLKHTMPAHFLVLTCINGYELKINWKLFCPHQVSIQVKSSWKMTTVVLICRPAVHYKEPHTILLENKWSKEHLTTIREQDWVLSHHLSKSQAKRNNLPWVIGSLQLVLIQKLVNTMLEKYCWNWLFWYQIAGYSNPVKRKNQYKST